MKKRLFYGITCIGIIFMVAGLCVVMWLKRKRSSVTIIMEGADGPTSIFLAGKLK